MDAGTVPSLLQSVIEWARARTDLRALALVGSHARGDARPDSDLDLLLLCAEPQRYLERTAWTAAFGAASAIRRESWGRVQSLRVFYKHGTEVEFGITDPAWAGVPAEPGTAAVARGGLRNLLDRDGALVALLESLAR